MTHDGDSNEILCCGTGLGYILLWKQCSTTMMTEFEETLARRVGAGHEIMGMSTMGHWLITGTRDKQVQVWSVDTKCTLCTVFSMELPTTVPRAVYFQGADILVFGMFDGEM